MSSPNCERWRPWRHSNVCTWCSLDLIRGRDQWVFIQAVIDHLGQDVRTSPSISLFRSLSRMASLLILDMGLFFLSDGCAWNSCSARCSSLAEVWLRARPQNFYVRGSILVAREFSLASYSSLSLSLAVIFSNRARAS
jgi:hypothetical protein